MSPHEGFWEGEPAGREKEETELEWEEVEASPSSSCKRRPWPREKRGPGTQGLAVVGGQVRGPGMRPGREGRVGRGRVGSHADAPA